MGQILQGAKNYCRRLESSALDFVCLEEIQEQTFLSDADASSEQVESGREQGFWPQTPWRSHIRQWVFDYQYVRKNNAFRFPSRDVTEEAYINAKGKKFVRSLPTGHF